jgi:hypothetical protein
MSTKGMTTEHFLLSAFGQNSSFSRLGSMTNNNTIDDVDWAIDDVDWANVGRPSPFICWILVAFGAIFALYGISAFYSGIRDLNQAKASVDWPTSPGRVLSSSVVQKRDSDDDGVMYHAEVVYVFNLNNTAYSGKRIAYGDYGSSNPSHAQKIVNRYPQDKNVTIHYMPNNPKECLLEVGVKGQAHIIPAIGSLFAIIGLIISIVGIVRLLK